MAALLLGALSSAPSAARLADELGRNEVRVWAAPYRLETGVELSGARLPERLERLGYERVRERPGSPGEFFWGHETFWIFRREHRWDGKPRPAELIRLGLDRASGRIRAVLAIDPKSGELEAPRSPWIEPELLAESLDADRAQRISIHLEKLPEHVPAAVLAIEDARFFQHPGVDARAVARALLRNARAGRIAQGGSTITQQLIKLRDLSGRRTIGRKASEAVRALALEAAYDKREILEAYLDSVYFGHFDGVAIYGYGAAARAFFGKRATELSLNEAALMAAMIQGPNRLNPVRHPDRALARQRLVLERMVELQWATPDAAAAAGARLPRLRLDPPDPLPGRQFLAWLAEESRRRAPARSEQKRGVVAESWLDPLLQADAETAVRRGLDRLRRAHRDLGSRPLSAALVAIDLASGGVIALVGGDPAAADDFDRVRKAERQPGSAIKPLVLLEAFESCGGREPLHPASRLADRELEIELPDGIWRPRNSDDRFRGVVTARQALVQSLNVPLIRAARWCGFEATADRLRRTGYRLPETLPPSFVLGSVETTPLELAGAYSAIVGRGRAVPPRPLRRLARPSGRTIHRYAERGHKVVAPSTAYLVRDLMIGAVERGTAQGARIEGRTVFGKTGTSSDRRDAWFVGGSGKVLTVVWVGVDDGSSLGLGGGEAAVPIWRDFMVSALASRPAADLPRPAALVTRWIDSSSGLRLRSRRSGAYEEMFRRGVEPRRRRWYRSDLPAPVIE